MTNIKTTATRDSKGMLAEHETSSASMSEAQRFCERGKGIQDIRGNESSNSNWSR